MIVCVCYSPLDSYLVVAKPVDGSRLWRHSSHNTPVFRFLSVAVGLVEYNQVTYFKYSGHQSPTFASKYFR